MEWSVLTIFNRAIMNRYSNHDTNMTQTSQLVHVDLGAGPYMMERPCMVKDDVGYICLSKMQNTRPKGDQNGEGRLEGEQRVTPSYTKKTSQEKDHFQPPVQM